jgi:membrane protein YqaA with SNARE-associated domain
VLLFSSLYVIVLGWAVHRHAQWYLAGLSFAESSFFPIPPDVMLAPMSLANTTKAWRFASITTVASVFGGMAGYLIGYVFYDLIEPLLRQGENVDQAAILAVVKSEAIANWLHQGSYLHHFQSAVAWMEEWGVWVVFIAGFSPIPYKVFTITAGALSMSFLPFVIASIVGRGARFFLVAGLMVWGGEAMEQKLRQYVNWLGWAVVAIVVIALIWVQYSR